MSLADCPIDGCTAKRRDSHLMCRTHWYLVPAGLRSRIWTAARRMWDEEEPGGPLYQEWRELRDEAVAIVEGRV